MHKVLRIVDTFLGDPGGASAPRPLSLLVKQMWLDDEAEAAQYAAAAGWAVDQAAHTFSPARVGFTVPFCHITCMHYRVNLRLQQPI